MEGTRLRILQLLQKHSNENVEGLAREIALAPATIRRHLDILQRDRLVAFVEVRKKTGRPEYSYYLTEDGHESLPKDYDVLLNQVVQELAGLTAEDTVRRDGRQILELLFERLAGKLGNEYEQRLQGRDLKSRLGTLMRLLTERDFSPEAQVTDGTLELTLLNCPFRLVALRNDAVCALDAHLISSILHRDMARDVWIHNGDAACVYSAPVDDRDAEALARL